MKKSKSQSNRNMSCEYDFSKGRRGKYARRYAKGTNLVALAPDVAKTFPDSQAVNEALSPHFSPTDQSRARKEAVGQKLLRIIG